MKKIITFLVVLVTSSTTLIKPYTGCYTDKNGNCLESNNINSNTIKGFQINIDCTELSGCFWGSMFSSWDWGHRQLVKTIWINVSGSCGTPFCICQPQLQSHFPNANFGNTQMNFPDVNPPGSFILSNPGYDYDGYATWSSNC